MPGIRIGWIGCLVIALSAASASPVHAQAVPDPDAAANAEAAFVRGKNLAKKNDRAGAYAAYTEAWAFRQTYDIAANLGIAEVKLKQFRDAAEHLTYSERTRAAERHREAARAGSEVPRQRQEGSRHHPRRRDRPSANVLIDGGSPSILPGSQDVFVTPGQHVVSAFEKGYTASEQPVNVAKGTSENAHITLTDAAPIAPPPPVAAAPVAAPATSDAPPIGAPVAAPPVTELPRKPVEPLPPPAERPNRVAVVLGSFVGAAGVGMGIGLFAAAARNGSDARSIAASIKDRNGGCGPQGSAVFRSDCSAFDSAASSHNTLQRVGVGSFIVGGAAIGATVGYLLWSRSKPEGKSRGMNLHVLPELDGTTRGLLIERVF